METVSFLPLFLPLFFGALIISEIVIIIGSIAMIKMCSDVEHKICEDIKKETEHGNFDQT